MANAGITFEKVEQDYYPEWGFRPKTTCYPFHMGFIFINGGMGDYLTWLRPAQWLCTDATWIRPTFFVPNYLQEVAEYFLKPLSQHAEVLPYGTLQDMQNKRGDLPIRGPVMLQQESLNATGAHLFTCGWVYFTNKERAPGHADRSGLPWNHYPKFKQADLDAARIPEAAAALTPGRYAVVTTGQTTPSRHVRPEYWNYVIEHVRAQGLTPVFLGKRVTETGNLRNIHTEYARELRLDLGVNLLDQTSLFEAAAIMSRAAYVVGHDNGLLHLAGCTEVPIVFGYNLASPEHRKPIRTVGQTYDVALTHEELPCTFCQSRTNFVIGFNFRSCFYGDLRCMELLFANKAAKWREQMDAALVGE